MPIFQACLLRMLQAVNILFILGNIKFVLTSNFQRKFFYCRFIYLFSDQVHSTLNDSDCTKELIFKNLDFFKNHVVEITNYMWIIFIVSLDIIYKYLFGQQPKSLRTSKVIIDPRGFFLNYQTGGGGGVYTRLYTLCCLITCRKMIHIILGIEDGCGKRKNQLSNVAKGQSHHWPVLTIKAIQSSTQLST